MKFYKRHLGDYARKTRHLGALEHGIYNLLIDDYYSREKGPTMDEARRICGAKTRKELNAVQRVLVEFFSLNNGRFESERIDEVIALYHAKAKKNKENGKFGGRPKAAKEETQTVSKTEPVNNPSHKPVTSNQKEQELLKGDSPSGELSPASPKTVDLLGEEVSEEDTAGAPPCPIKRIIAIYHEELPSLSRVREFPEQAVRMLRARWRSEPERQDVEWWRDWFKYIRTCPYLMGEVNGFVADLAWLVRPTNFAKVINGNYEART